MAIDRNGNEHQIEITERDNMHICCQCAEECVESKWALYVDSVPDKSVPGMHNSECGYSRRYFCHYHAMQRITYVGNTSRVTEIKWMVKTYG